MKKYAYHVAGARRVRNLELKVRCENTEHLKVIEALAQKNGASYLYTMEQRDTYFRVSHGRLKLRERWLQEQDEAQSPAAELIYYNRPSQEASRISDYDVMPVAEPELLRSMLTRALDGTLAVVEKVRVLYIYKHTRIHLDTVKFLGTFVELETVMQEAMPMEDVKAEHQYVLAFLGLGDLEMVGDSYSDLVMRG
jgi:adenylate cyclase class 2